MKEIPELLSVRGFKQKVTLNITNNRSMFSSPQLCNKNDVNE